MKKIFYMILLIILLSFSYTIQVVAEGDYSSCPQAYEKYESIFALISSCNARYYQSSSFGDEDDVELSSMTNLAQKCPDDVYNIMKNSGTKQEYFSKILVTGVEIRYGSTGESHNTKLCSVLGTGDAENCENYELGRETIYGIQFVSDAFYMDGYSEIQRLVRSSLYQIAKACDDGNGCTGSNCTYTSKYNNVYAEVYEGFSSFCQYIKTHKGVSYYVKIIIRIISYASLALAVVLGSLDFIKAITSHDDAALNKAFQTFMKRLAAVAVIFLAYIIVQIFMGLITSIPNYDASQLEICGDFKIGALQNN